MSLLELYDADGTLNTIDIEHALDGAHDDEVSRYLVAASEFIAEKTTIPQSHVHAELGRIIRDTVFPRRTELQYWATFPTADKQGSMPIAPAVDHFLLVAGAAREFLARALSDAPVGSETARKIEEFSSSPWAYPLFKHASDASLLYASMDDDAIAAIDERLSRNALAALFSNSSTVKAVTLLSRGGFGKFITADGRIERGKIAAIGNGEKFQVDASVSAIPSSSVDLRPFGLPVELDLRREAYRKKVAILIAQTGAKEIFMASDIPEMDLYPLRAWYGELAHLAMKTNPTSAPESINAARELLHAQISSQLSELTRDLP